MERHAYAFGIIDMLYVGGSAVHVGGTVDSDGNRAIPPNNCLFGAFPVTSLRELLILVRFMFLLKLLMNESFQEISHFFSGSSLVACFLRL